MKTHIQNVEKGLATMTTIPNNKVPSYTEIRDFAYHDIPAFTHKQSKPVSDPLSGPVENIEKFFKRAAEFKKNFNAVIGSNNFPQFSNLPNYQFPLAPLQQELASLPRPMPSHATPILGHKLIVCEKCTQFELVHFYLNTGPESTAWLTAHNCQPEVSLAPAKKQEWLQAINREFIDRVVTKILICSDQRPCLIALEVNPSDPSIFEQFNHVDFGVVGEQDFIYKTAQASVTSIANPQDIRSFVSKAKATYCLVEFTHMGARKFYFMYFFLGKIKLESKQLDGKPEQEKIEIGKSIEESTSLNPEINEDQPKVSSPPTHQSIN